MKKILITGATGLIGQELVKSLLAKNVSVNYLTTNKSKLKNEPLLKGFFWNPDNDEIDTEAFNDVDVIINLAGATLAKRSTKTWKKTLVDSRIKSTRLLFKTVKQGNYHLTQIINASAIGYYPYSLTNYYDEDYKATNNEFVSHLVQQWEAEAEQFKTIGVLVCKVRIGLVLSSKGGALPKLVKPIKWFVGSALGTGKQWQSWIHIQDIVGMFVFIAENELEGTFNGVAPNPVTQQNLTKGIAKALSRPILLPRLPEFILSILLGKMSELVVKGQRVSAQKITNFGFTFRFNTLKSALKNLL